MQKQRNKTEISSTHICMHNIARLIYRKMCVSDSFGEKFIEPNQQIWWNEEKKRTDDDEVNWRRK